MFVYSMGAIEDHEAYQKAKNDPSIMNSAEVKDPSSIKPSKLGEAIGGHSLPNSSALLLLSLMQLFHVLHLSGIPSGSH